MSEVSDDAQLAATEGAAPQGGADASPDLDDVEVVAHAPDPEPTPRMDSAIPTSRKLAPPPKPRRDSQHPSVAPPDGGVSGESLKPRRDSQHPSVAPPDGGVSGESLKVPSAPSISFHEAGYTSLDSVAVALASTDSLRAIGEALTSEAAARVSSEVTPIPSIASIGIPPLASSAEAPRSPSEPPAARHPAPSTPDEAPSGSSSRGPSKAIFVQRIIAVGTPSDRVPAPAVAPRAPSPFAPEAAAAAAGVAPPAPAGFDWVRTLDAAPEPTAPRVAQMVPPPVAPTVSPSPVEPVLPPVMSRPASPIVSPSQVEPSFPPRVVLAPAAAGSAPPVAAASVESGFPPPVMSAPTAPVVSPSQVEQGFPPVVMSRLAAPTKSPSHAEPGFPPPVVDRSSSAARPSEPAVMAPPPVPATAPPTPFPEELDAGALSITVDVAMDEPSPDQTAPEEALPHIPITTDEDEERTSPSASVAPLESPLVEVAPGPLGVPPIPDEPTPPPPARALADVPATAQTEEPPRASLDSRPVEELAREGSPSVPPQPPAPAVSPSRAEVKPPPPPKRAPAPATSELSAEPGKKKSKQKRPWWEELFSEDFVRANWKVSDEQIKREVTFVEESLGVAPGGVVLDLGCGSGQHAVELASRGYGVVGYDLSLYQLALAADNAQERSQKINFLQGDMREMAFEEMFDGIFCWNTSFGYFEEDKNFSVAERAFRALRPGGMFLVDVINRDFVAAHTPSSVWFEGDACVCMDDAVIDYFTSRLRVKRSVILDDGRTRECTYSVRLYSFHELGKLLHEVGFRVTEVSGHPATPGVFLGQASPRILMLAQRP